MINPSDVFRRKNNFSRITVTPIQNSMKYREYMATSPRWNIAEAQNPAIKLPRSRLLHSLVFLLSYIRKNK